MQLPPERGDLYGFLRNSILFPPVTSIATLDIPCAIDFYTGSWSKRFGAYDASYLREPAEVKRSIRDAVARLVSASSGPSR